MFEYFFSILTLLMKKAQSKNPRILIFYNIEVSYQNIKFYLEQAKSYPIFSIVELKYFLHYLS